MSDTAKPSASKALIEPTDDERKHWFDGLEGSGLVARTSCHDLKWGSFPITKPDEHTGAETPRHKILMPVGYLAKFKDEDNDATIKLRKAYPAITEALNDAKIEWSTFFGIRIGYSDAQTPEEFPLVLYIKVDAGTTFAQVAPAVQHIKDVILTREGLPNIHVEVHEGPKECKDFYTIPLTSDVKEALKHAKEANTHVEVHEGPKE